MAIKISKCLKSALAQTTFDLKHKEKAHSYLDHLFINIMREPASLAYKDLQARVSTDGLQHIISDINHLIISQPTHEHLTPEIFFTHLSDLLIATTIEAEATSLHFLQHIATKTHTATSQMLAHYGITASSYPRPWDNLPINPQSPLSTKSITYIEPKTAAPELLIERFSTELTKLASTGAIDPVIGRENDIERLSQILCRRKKNNPLLVGDAGVGKSAIVEGLALKIANGDVPQRLRGAKIYSLNMAALVAGTKFRGEFEERINQMIEELGNESSSVVFIDEIHTIAGAGATQGNLDVANILKPALARGNIRLVGATTYDEYRKHIESDAALARRFQLINIKPTTIEQTMDILLKIAPTYERHHGVKFLDEALIGCVELSQRYIPDRNLPDKAIDLMDEAGAYIQQHSFSPNQTPMVTLRDVEKMITLTTGIPTAQITMSERERLAALPQHLRSRIIGQDRAIELLTRRIAMYKLGVQRSDRPIGVFLFTGPTGVGKTMLARELSNWLFKGERGLIRIDLSEYGQQHTVSRLIGSPPGYIGYGEGGQLSEAVRQNPHSVVLFDEVEKAHSEVLNLMLQIFDEGHLTNGSGRRIDFRNTIIILTSNIGSDKASKPRILGYDTSSKRRNQRLTSEEQALTVVEQTLSPELLNRIDEVICFRSLDMDDARQIIDIELDSLCSRTLKLGYSLNISEQAKEHLATIGFEPKYGARALRRTITRSIEEPIAQLIIEGKLSKGGRVNISLCEEQIELKVA